MKKPPTTTGGTIGSHKSLSLLGITAIDEHINETINPAMDTRSAPIAFRTAFRLRSNSSRKPSWAKGKDGTIANMMDVIAT
jgi:hypothetical protein